MSHPEDTVIINQILQGDTQAFAILIERYERLVFTLCMRMLKNREDAEEVAQDVFVKSYQKLNTFKGNSKFSTWLYRITYNRCLDTLSRKRKHPTARDIDEIHPVGIYETYTVLDALEDAERTKHLKMCIDKLPEDEAFLITVYYFEEQSITELAAITGLSQSNIKVKLYRARKRLYTLINANLFYEKKQVL